MIHALEDCTTGWEEEGMKVSNCSCKIGDSVTTPRKLKHIIDSKEYILGDPTGNPWLLVNVPRCYISDNYISGKKILKLLPIIYPHSVHVKDSINSTETSSNEVSKTNITNITNTTSGEH